MLQTISTRHSSLLSIGTVTHWSGIAKRLPSPSVCYVSCENQPGSFFLRLSISVFSTLYYCAHARSPYLIAIAPLSSSRVVHDHVQYLGHVALMFSSHAYVDDGNVQDLGPLPSVSGTSPCHGHLTARDAHPFHFPAFYFHVLALPHGPLPFDLDVSHGHDLFRAHVSLTFTLHYTETIF